MTNILFLSIGIITGYLISLAISHYKNLKESKRILDEITSIEDEFFELDELIPCNFNEENHVFGRIVYSLNLDKNTLEYLTEQKPLKETLKEQLQVAINKEDYLLAKEIHNKLKLL